MLLQLWGNITSSAGFSTDQLRCKYESKNTETFQSVCTQSFTPPVLFLRRRLKEMFQRSEEKNREQAWYDTQEIGTQVRREAKGSPGGGRGSLRTTGTGMSKPGRASPPREGEGHPDGRLQGIKMDREVGMQRGGGERDQFNYHFKEIKRWYKKWNVNLIFFNKGTSNSKLFFSTIHI